MIREFNLEGSVLKVDCEGCEYNTIAKAEPKVLNAFEEIIIEYHNGPKPIIKALERAGLKTKTKPIRSAKVPMERQGYVHGTK
ncbi:hypothetical protein [Vulcanisaeta distributa]|uniref:hypothetical protein n=1 Tax=Vulcanisaeta distributa TaxID=164451 RepID=UPI0006CFCC88|nr:hypothetical protein [Vulcanisaeta distributa]